MKRFLIIALLAAPLIYFGGRFLGTVSANSTVTRFWDGWRMSQTAPITEAIADNVSVKDRTGFLIRVPYGSKADVASYFANELFWWGTSEPERSFAITSTTIDGKSAIVTGQLKANLFGSPRILTLQFELIKQENWDICGITFVDIT